MRMAGLWLVLPLLACALAPGDAVEVQETGADGHTFRSRCRQGGRSQNRLADPLA